MIYELHFHPSALKEWKKLPQPIKQQFKIILQRRLKHPHIASAKLSARLKSCYKIKLRNAGYRLVYHVKDRECTILIVAVGKRNKNLVYQLAGNRLS